MVRQTRNRKASVAAAFSGKKLKPVELSSKAVDALMNSKHIMPEGSNIEVIGSVKSDDETQQLRQYKDICDKLLPGMRSRSHLYNLIFRDKRNISILLTNGENRLVFGGCTVRIFRVESNCIVLDFLAMVVDQKAGLCGMGFGTRLVNTVKLLAMNLKEEKDVKTCFVVTQADNQAPAINFWQKQLLELSNDATLAVKALFRMDPKNVVYENSIPMMLELERWNSHVDGTPSERAQLRQRVTEEEVTLRCVCRHKLRGGRTVSCDFCGGHLHYECVKDIFDEATEVFICPLCDSRRIRLKHGLQQNSEAASTRGRDAQGIPERNYKRRRVDESLTQIEKPNTPVMIDGDINRVRTADATVADCDSADARSHSEISSTASSSSFGSPTPSQEQPLASCFDEDSSHRSAQDLVRNALLQIANRDKRKRAQETIQDTVEQSADGTLPQAATTLDLTANTASDFNVSQTTERVSTSSMSTFEDMDLTPIPKSQVTLVDVENEHMTHTLTTPIPTPSLTTESTCNRNEPNTLRLPPQPVSSRLSSNTTHTPRQDNNVGNSSNNGNNSNDDNDKNVCCNTSNDTTNTDPTNDTTNNTDYINTDPTNDTNCPTNNTDSKTTDTSNYTNYSTNTTDTDTDSKATDVQKSTPVVFTDPLGLVWRMHEACDTDVALLMDGDRNNPYRGDNCLAMLAEVIEWENAPTHRKRELLAGNFLSAVRRWLAPSKDKYCLPIQRLRTRIFRLLEKLSPHVRLHHLTKSGGLVHVLLRYSEHPLECVVNCQVAANLCSSWEKLLSAHIAAPRMSVHSSTMKRGNHRGRSLQSRPKTTSSSSSSSSDHHVNAAAVKPPNRTATSFTTASRVGTTIPTTNTTIATNNTTISKDSITSNEVHNNTCREREHQPTSEDRVRLLSEHDHDDHKNTHDHNNHDDHKNNRDRNNHDDHHHHHHHDHKNKHHHNHHDDHTHHHHHDHKNNHHHNHHDDHKNNHHHNHHDDHTHHHDNDCADSTTIHKQLQPRQSPLQKLKPKAEALKKIKAKSITNPNPTKPTTTTTVQPPLTNCKTTLCNLVRDRLRPKYRKQEITKVEYKSLLTEITREMSKLVRLSHPQLYSTETFEMPSIMMIVFEQVLHRHLSNLNSNHTLHTDEL